MAFAGNKSAELGGTVDLINQTSSYVLKFWDD